MNSNNYYYNIYICRNGQLVFFVASRGHHADVGGIAPGSMPPLSKVI
jgi:5-oxoprolinase (ATP-hydrolysing)